MFKIVLSCQVLAFSFVLAIVQVDSTSLLSPNTNALQNSMGGACQDCRVITGGCSGSYCFQMSNSTTVWIKATPTNLSPVECYDVGEGKTGTKDDCSSDTPKDCFLSKHCTDANCVNCEDNDPIQRESVCTLAGEACYGPPSGG